MTKDKALAIRKAAAAWRLKADKVSNANLRLIINSMIYEAEEDVIDLDVEVKCSDASSYFNHMLHSYLDFLDLSEWNCAIDEAYVNRAVMWFKAQGV